MSSVRNRINRVSVSDIKGMLTLFLHIVTTTQQTTFFVDVMALQQGGGVRGGERDFISCKVITLEGGVRGIGIYPMIIGCQYTCNLVFKPCQIRRTLSCKYARNILIIFCQPDKSSIRMHVFACRQENIVNLSS